jgi:hypothetical protein
MVLFDLFAGLTDLLYHEMCRVPFNDLLDHWLLVAWHDDESVALA